MSESAGPFKYFLYATAKLDSNGTRRYLSALESICWSQTSLVRFRRKEFASAGPEDVLSCALIVMEWDGEGSEAFFHAVRGWEAKEDHFQRPILILRAGTMRRPVEDQFRHAHPRAALLDTSEVSPAALKAALLKLDFELPLGRRLDLAKYSREPAIAKIIQDVGEVQLDLALRKYFPMEADPALFPVEGGWSGDPLLRVSARIDDGPAREFFLKLFSRSEKFTNEIEKHEGAYEWLKTKSAGIPLHRIPDVGPTATEQLAAFPSVSGLGPTPVFPACYISASADTEHRTFKELFYSPNRLADVGTAFARILKILSPDKIAFLKDQAPFAAAKDDGPLSLTDARRTTILRAIGELDRCGPAACGSEWSDCRARLDVLVYRPLYGELIKRRAVAVGPIHGDPNPRNCLVDPKSPAHVLMIDCGDFDPLGRLVFDLALIERDIKLVLMGNETLRGGFFDLDPVHLSAWCAAEKRSIEKGVGYSARDLDGLKHTCPSAYAAHSLVVALRRQMKALCPSDDIHGRHYFAALLFWMIKGLEERAIPPTKKLLALYSMAQILKAYF